MKIQLKKEYITKLFVKTSLVLHKDKNCYDDAVDSLELFEVEKEISDSETVEQRDLNSFEKKYFKDEIEVLKFKNK
jgi:hypothetical protein